MADKRGKSDGAKATHFKPGTVANPKGRPKGSRNKLGEDFLEALAEDFETNGKNVIQKVRLEKPDVYLKVIAAVLPKDINVKHTLVEEIKSLSDEEINERIRRLESAAAGIPPEARTH